MKILKFKTNIQDQDGIAAVARLLDQQEEISNWQVDPDADDHILSVSGQNPNPQKIEDAVKAAGFEIEMVRVVGTSGEGL
ncbi:copper chaperone [Rufibacter psychrotolerans]|uniref:copper chaperone n=1 Tax=Rufibacter psychrotolerans TaxID=2812556 RepID=UPI001968A3EE|nr:copper chaperone [Rufibacter sp. SYSU D00308]